ncbi:hypothetical protein [Nonomuraea endophytica]|uniref:hypothetical protein n=1 Tax=Nonomuraea endophytica TaxID=714136 RepID=UPI0037C8BF45
MSRYGDHRGQWGCGLLVLFGSSVIYGQLKKGRTYRVKVSGSRVPATSYPNTLSIHSEIK